MLKKQIPLKQGLFTLPLSGPDGAHLLGSKCDSCGVIFFPQRIVCLNCGRRNPSQIALGKRGKIHTFTIVEQAPPGAIVQAPYVVAAVALPEGVFVDTVLTDCEPAALKLGAEVEIVFKKVTEDQQGNEVLAYMFRPLKSITASDENS